MKIAISGCGITGTASAFFLSKAGHDVTIFEQAPECKPIGAGIMLQPSGQAVIQRMDLLDSLTECSQRLGGMIAQRTNGKKLVELQYNWLDQTLFGLGVHRGRLFERLLKACEQEGTRIVNDVRVIGFHDIGSAPIKKIQIKTEIENEGKSFGEFDFLIAADGGNSKLRAASEIKTKTLEYDHAALWMTGKSSFQPNYLYQVVKGTQHLIGVLPIGLGECSFFWGLKANELDDLRSSDFEAWKGKVVRLCPESESVMANVKDFNQFTFARYRHVVMKRKWASRVIFLGDAAHATSPHLGQGVNLGLEDAASFADSLEAKGDFVDACDLFARNRAAKTAYYQRLTKFLSPFFQSDSKLKGTLRDVFLPWLPYLPLVKREMLRTLSGLKNGWLR